MQNPSEDPDVIKQLMFNITLEYGFDENHSSEQATNAPEKQDLSTNDEMKSLSGDSRAQENMQMLHSFNELLLESSNITEKNLDEDKNKPNPNNGIMDKKEFYNGYNRTHLVNGFDSANDANSAKPESDPKEAAELTKTVKENSGSSLPR